MAAAEASGNGRGRVISGRRHSDRGRTRLLQFRLAESRLEELPPVTFDANPGVTGRDRPFRLRLTGEALQVALFQISNDRSARDAWSQLPEFTRYARVNAPKPGAQVWLEHPVGRMKMCCVDWVTGVGWAAMKYILLSIVGAACVAKAEVAVTVGEVSDKRTTGEFFSGLELKLLLAGPELADAKGVRVTVDSATDDTGKNLVDPKRAAFSDDFKPLEEPFGLGPNKKKGTYEIALALVNPLRTAKTVKLAGKAELMSPKADPASIVTASVAKAAGKPLVDAALKAAGVVITFKAPKGDDLAYELNPE